MITKLDEKTRIYEGIVNVLRFTKSLNIDSICDPFYEFLKIYAWFRLKLSFIFFVNIVFQLFRNMLFV